MANIAEISEWLSGGSESDTIARQSGMRPLKSDSQNAVKTAAVTAESPWTATYILRKSGHVVNFQLAGCRVTTATTMQASAFGQNKVATLPKGFRPINNIHGFVGGNSTTRKAVLYIKTTGEVYLDYPNSTTAPTSGGFSGSITFFTE